jgi:Spy/CpxP family protein refolding chaperone
MPGGGPPPDPAIMIQMKVDRLATLLSLTDAQKTQATTIFTNAYNAGQSIHTSLQTDQQTLSTAVKANSAATIDQVSGTIGTLEGQLTAINAKADAAFYALLTADQKAKYDALPHGGPGFGPPGRGGFRGGPPHQ